MPLPSSWWPDLLAGGPAWLARQVPELAALDGVPDRARAGRTAASAWAHTEAVWAGVRSSLLRLPEERAQVLALATLLHDVGWTASPVQAQTYTEHTHAGAALARDVLFRLPLPGLSRDEIVYLVRDHTLPYLFNKRYASAPYLWRLAWSLDTRLLADLAVADNEARELATVSARGRALAALMARCQELHILGHPPPGLLPAKEWQQLAPRDPWLRRRTAGEVRFWRVKGMIQSGEDERAWLQAQRPEPAGTLYLLVGVPGSGKSTWVERNLPQARVVSMDEVRAQLSGTREDQSRNAQVFARCRATVTRALRCGETVVWDAQSHTWASRQGLLALARESHAYVIVVYLDTPLAVALERNARRDTPVPEAIIRRNYVQLQEPRPFEADELWRVNVKGEYIVTRMGD